MASVSNDIIYASAGMVFLILAGLLVGFLRSARTPSEDGMWDGQDAMSEAAFGDGENTSNLYQKEAVALQTHRMLLNPPLNHRLTNESTNLVESLLETPSMQAPSQS